VLPGPRKIAITIDAQGSVIEELGVGGACGGGPTCRHIRALGDIDGDGFDDILIDNRGGYMPAMGAVELIRWKRGVLLRDELIVLAGG